MNSQLPYENEIETTKQRAKKEQRISVLFLLALIVLVPIFSSGKEADGLFVWENRILQITLPNEQIYSIPYDSIESLTIIESPDFGTCLSGKSDNNLRWGIWKNDLLGEYILCTYRSFDTVIQVQTETNIFWIGYESSQTTRLLYQSFLEHWGQ